MVKDTGHPTLAHDQDTVGHTEKLRHLGGYHDDGVALLGKLTHDLVDLVLGADVNAAGRLVKDQDVCLREQPTADEYLLLVAAGQILDLHLIACRASSFLGLIMWSLFFT